MSEVRPELLGPCRQRAVWPDLDMAYDTRGDSGTPVLLVMGYTAPGRAWQNQVPALADKHRVAWFDHRGSGDTKARKGAYVLDLLAADTLRLADHLGWDRFHLVGVSMGGMVSQELALRARRRVRSLTLIATHAGGLRARLPTPKGLSRFVVANVAPRRQRLEHLKHLLFPAEWLATADQEWLGKVLQNEFGQPLPLAYKLSQLAAVMRHDTRGRLGELAGLPALIVRPGRDILIDPCHSDELQRLIPGSKLLRFDDAGHGVVRQSVDELNAALLTHFAAVDQATGAADAA